MESNVQVKDEIDEVDLENCQPPSSKPVSKPLSDGSRDETPVPTYKHKWTVEQRITLAMLADNYSNNWGELTSVFNHWHRSDLRRCGGLRRPVVSTQYHDMRTKFDATAALRNLQDSLSPYERSSLASLGGLQKKANEIGIQLEAKGSTDISNQRRILYEHDKPRLQKRKRADPIDDSRTDFLPDYPGDEKGTAADFRFIRGLPYLPKTPTRNSSQQEPNGLLTPPDSRKRKMPRLTVDKRLAGIGFRAFHAQSQGTYSSTLGIRAGAFRNCPNIPLARDLDITRYREEALHHVTYYNHSRPSMFISATKNPMRAIHILLHAPQGEKGLILIDLNAADESGNVEKARNLNLQTKFRYTAASEYLIFGGVGPRAIISYIPLQTLLSKLPKIPDDEDPFRFKLLQAHETLSHARSAIKRDVLPMTYSLGMALGELVGILCVPPKNFETAVWAFVQDYKFYKAEGGKRRHWADNTTFRDGAIQAYQAIRKDNLATFEIESQIRTAKEIIEIEDDSEFNQAEDSDSESSSEDVPTLAGVEDRVRNTQASQPSLQYYDLETSKWMSKDEDVSDDFLGELTEVVGNLDNNNSPDNRKFAENDMDILRSTHEDKEMDSDTVTVPAGNHSKELMNLDELCADLMKMHRDEDITQEQETRNMEADYEFAWTGM